MSSNQQDIQAAMIQKQVELRAAEIAAANKDKLSAEEIQAMAEFDVRLRFTAEALALQEFNQLRSRGESLTDDELERLIQKIEAATRREFYRKEREKIRAEGVSDFRAAKSEPTRKAAAAKRMAATGKILGTVPDSSAATLAQVFRGIKRTPKQIAKAVGVAAYSAQIISIFREQVALQRDLRRLEKAEHYEGDLREQAIQATSKKLEQVKQQLKDTVNEGVRYGLTSKTEIAEIASAFAAKTRENVTLENASKAAGFSFGMLKQSPRLFVQGINNISSALFQAASVTVSSPNIARNTDKMVEFDLARNRGRKWKTAAAERIARDAERVAGKFRSRAEASEADKKDGSKFRFSESMVTSENMVTWQNPELAGVRKPISPYVGGKRPEIKPKVDGQQPPELPRRKPRRPGSIEI